MLKKLGPVMLEETQDFFGSCWLCHLSKSIAHFGALSLLIIHQGNWSLLTCQECNRHCWAGEVTTGFN